jgi:glycosyltransferase involved in cell wall biosynthesis
MITVADLPPAPIGRIGFPWTEGSGIHFSNGGEHLPLISIITPSYNQGTFLEETIRSVLLQGYPKLEYIIIDGGSTDNSLDIIRQYAPYLAHWVSEADRGQTHAINKGLNHSTGAVMGWLNSDDVLLPDALSRIGAAFAADPARQVVCGFRKVIDMHSQFVVNGVRGIPHSRVVRHRNIIAQETVYWRREVFEKVGLLDENLRFVMDYDYWQRILAAGYEFRLIPFYLGGFRRHAESKTATLETLYQAELDALFRRYGVADNEREAVRRLGRLWDWRYDLIKDLCHQRIFDDPGRAHRIIQVLELPLLSPVILGLHRLYRWLR